MRHTTALNPSALEWSFADRLRKVRRDVAQTGQAEFAQALNVNLKAYSAWESGKNTPRELVAIAKRIELVTGVPATWMLGISEVVAPAATGTDGQAKKTTVWYSPEKSRTVVPFPQLRAV